MLPTVTLKDGTEITGWRGALLAIPVFPIMLIAYLCGAATLKWRGKLIGKQPPPVSKRGRNRREEQD